MKASGIDISADLSALGDQVLNPVAPKAQKKVPVPEGLDLDAQINEIPPEEDSDEEKNSYVGAPIFDQKQEEMVEKETEEEREEKRRQRLRDRQSNPYFLTDEPPNYHFKEDLPSIQDITNDHNFGVSKFNSGYQQPQPAFVNMAMEAPEGVNLSSDSEDESKKKHDPLADIDLHSELKPGESLFRREHRIVQTSAAKPKKEKSKKEKKKKDKKDRDGKKSKKESRDKKEKKGKSRKESTSGRGAQSSLIDLNDMFGNPVSTPSPVAPSSSAPSLSTSPLSQQSYSSQSHISSFPFQSSPSQPNAHASSYSAPVAHQPSAPVVGTPLLGQPSTASNIPRTSSLGSHDSIGYPEKKSKKDKKSKKEKKSKSQRKSSQSSNGTSQNLLNLQSVPSFTLLARDPTLSLFYCVNASEKEVNKVIVTLSVNNTTSNPVSLVQLKVQGTLNLQLLNPPPADAVPAMQSKIYQLVFSVSQITIPQRLAATVSYSSGGKSQSLDFQIPFPCSVFILPVRINFEQLSKLLTGEAGVPFFQASESVDLSGSGGLDPRSALALLSSSLHLEVVEAVAAAASLYGRSIQGHHVAALVKQKSPLSISLDFKCSDGNLAGSLAKEAAILLRR
eukprot:TRINITY_DN3330_c0_g1_i1.p1 TRINITY_DN3330_c0_g1~~TRINITY_DN3330_c0_g1_i1.p1  ORF type:complete len:664 (-),score=215.67 TRINITY_DN3330_c0_g1_i1:114-1967(-)